MDRYYSVGIGAIFREYEEAYIETF